MRKIKKLLSLALCLILAVSVAGLQITANADDEKTTVYSFSAANFAWAKTEGCNPNNGWAWGTFATTSFNYNEDGSADINITADTYDKFRQFNSNFNNLAATTNTAYIDITNNSTSTIKVKIVTGGYTTPADSNLPTIASGKTGTIELGTLTGGTLQIMLQDFNGADAIVAADNLFKFSPIYTLSTTKPDPEPGDDSITAVYKLTSANYGWSKTEGWNSATSQWGTFTNSSIDYKSNGSISINTSANAMSKFRQFNSWWTNITPTTQPAFIDITNNANKTIRVKIAIGGYTTPADTDLPKIAAGETGTIELGILNGENSGGMQIMIQDADNSDNLEVKDNIFTVSPIYIKNETTVTIDGNRNVVENGTFTFPENKGSDFVGYSDGTKLYAPGETIEVTKSISVVSMSLSLSMENGASIRYNTPNGMRFYTNIDTISLEILEDMGATVQLGTLVSREDIIGTEDLSFDMSGQFLDIQYNTREWYTEGDFSGFVGSIVNFREYNLNKKFAGRGYAKITLGDFEKTIYADYYSKDISNNLRSVCFIANSVKNDTAVYDKLTDSQKAVVDAYVAKYVAE